MAWEPGQPIDTRSVMTPGEYRMVAGLPEPPDGVGTRLTFTVMCPTSAAEHVKGVVLSDLRELHDMGVTGTYRQEAVRP